MMTRKELVAHIVEKKSVLCVGLDTDLDRIPEHLKRSEDPLFAFNKAIIDATADHCVAFKPNTAFYEAYGLEGWKSLERTVRYIKEEYPRHFVIADAKRGDIGNTAKRYAKAFLENMNCDAITVAPYMGEDSVVPFSGMPGKWVIVLGLTSNPGANDVQKLTGSDGQPIHIHTMDAVSKWLSPDEMMFVVGATRPEELGALRQRYPRTFFLVPGVGAQGGTVEDVIAGGWIDQEGGLLINASRSIIYADSTERFAEEAKAQSSALHEAMKKAF